MVGFNPITLNQVTGCRLGVLSMKVKLSCGHELWVGIETKRSRMRAGETGAWVTDGVMSSVI